MSVLGRSSESTVVAPDLGEKNTDDSFMVRFETGDLANPKNWSSLKKWYLTVAGGILVLNSTFASSAPSSIIPQLVEQFHVSVEVALLTISLFVAGYCVGPLLWGPLSEQYGRRSIFVVTFLCYTVLQIGTALSENASTILILRFFGGVFAAAPLTNVGALISDIWDARTRGKALAVFTVAPFAGPALGPIVAGYVVVGGLSWRWVFWITTIFAGVCWLQIVFTIPETYGPILLVKKAQLKRSETGDSRYYAPTEKRSLPFIQRIEHTLAKPFKVLFQEPMLIAITVYMSFIYGCIYLLFEAYPIVFTEGHHFNAGASGLMFLPLPLGGALGVVGYLLIFNPRYERAMLEHAPHAVPPEFRLEMGMVAAPLFAISFFWFGWTSFPSVHFAIPMMSGALMGFSICWMFLSLFNYIIDAYLYVAASALAANTVARSLFGAAFPLFASQMYDALGPRWASSLLGFVAVAMMPIPFILQRFGPVLRRNSKHTPKEENNVPKKSFSLA